jgi:hypothetical protein
MASQVGLESDTTNSRIFMRTATVGVVSLVFIVGVLVGTVAVGGKG